VFGETASCSPSLGKLNRDHLELSIRPVGDAGEVLDTHAIRDYKLRVTDLKQEITEAQAFNDIERKDRLQRELDFLLHELSAGLGKQGRPRRVCSDAERARVNVTRNLRDIIKKVSRHNPALGQHFTRTIRTGTFCSYRPDIQFPRTWSC
jgi:hypothetical protein